jgi:propanediol dehydratase small subunit
VYTNIFSGDRYSLDEIDDLGPDTIHLIRRQRTAVLNEYPTDELLQIYAVVRFFRGILDGLCNGDDDNREF